MRLALVLGSLVALPLAACGIDKEVHQQALDKLARCQQDLSTCTAERDTVAGTVKEQEAQLGELKGQLDTTSKESSAQLVSLKTNLEATESELGELRKQREAAEKRLAAFKQLQEKLRALTDTGKLKVSFRAGQMILDLPAGVLFKSGQANLSPNGKKALKEVTAILLEFKDRRLMFAGHTDNQKIATKRFPNNWHLSTARAVSVLEFFLGEGFIPENVAAAGYGEFAPVGDNATPEGRELNRRIEVILVPDLSELPTMTEG